MKNNVRIIKSHLPFEFILVTFAMNPNAIVNDMKSAKLDTRLRKALPARFGNITLLKQKR